MIGIVGLGKMGGGVAYRLVVAGHRVIGFDFSRQACERGVHNGCIIVGSVQELASHVSVLWLFVPAGDPVDQVLDHALPKLANGSIIIDGGNSHFSDSIRRAERCRAHGIFFLDCGTSGGVAGEQCGYCLMIGGDRSAYERVFIYCSAVAAPGGVGYVGPSGAGHYVKMIHNGIEYGVLQAYAEGFHLLKDGSFKDASLDLQEITRVWQHGALLRSWFLDLAHDVFKRDQHLQNISGAIDENGTGRWTVEEARKVNVPVPVIDQAVSVRSWSRATGGNYATKVVAMMRNMFGGHAVATVQESHNTKDRE